MESQGIIFEVMKNPENLGKLGKFYMVREILYGQGNFPYSHFLLLLYL